MSLIKAFLRLVRWPNLVFIVLTQVVFYTCILLPAYRNTGMDSAFFLSWSSFWLLVASSVLIAAAGYIINDYFDLNIDQVNKPEAIVVQKIIRRRWVIFWHMGLSVAGVVLAIVVSLRIGSWVVAPANLLCVLLLLFYSTTFKKKFLAGNIIISALTAWVVFVLYVSELDIIALVREARYQGAMRNLFKLTVVYGGFAFIISLVREVVKDMEDIRGDERYGCRTMPVVWGLPASKVFAGVWMVVLMLAVMVLVTYGIISGWWLAAAYGVFFVLLPLVNSLRRLYRATSTEDFHAVSSLIKLVMLSGILSMVFFKWHI